MQKVTVIIPTYNRESVLAFTIDSILAQSYQNWECIIVDDNSTDNTPGIAIHYSQKDDRIIFFRRDREPGNANTCRNIGLTKSTGEFVIFLDSDDLLKPDCLERRVHIATTNPGHEFWVFRVWRKENEKEIMDSRFLSRDSDMLNKFLEMKLPWLVTSPLWRREFISSIGGFEERLDRLQDVELHIRALANIKGSYYIDMEGDPDWSYSYRPFNKVQRNIPLLQKKIRSCLFICNEFGELVAGDRGRSEALQKGMSVCLVNFIYENRLNDFKAAEEIKYFLNGLRASGCISLGRLRKMKIVIAIPEFFLRLPGSYRAISAFLV